MAPSEPKSEAERGLECRAVGEAILQRQHDEPQLRHGALLGLQINRLRVEQRLPAGNHQQAAADHVRALLIPERELAGELRVLVDARFDLLRAVDEARLGKVEDHGVAVIARRRCARRSSRSCCCG